MNHHKGAAFTASQCAGAVAVRIQDIFEYAAMQAAGGRVRGPRRDDFFGVHGQSPLVVHVLIGDDDIRRVSADRAC